MFLPLPDTVSRSKIRNSIKVANNANRGLFYNKYFNMWPEGGGKLEPESKLEWIQKFCGITGDNAAIEQAVSRMSGLVNHLKGHIETMTQVSPLVTGMGLNHPVENGFLWHHTLGIPYIPGSGIKGLVRAWAEHWEGAETDIVRRLFGGSGKDPVAGNIIVFDALPVSAVELYAEVITPHDGGWRIKEDQGGEISSTPSDWVSPVPIPFLAVKPGTDFQFAFAPRRGAQEGDLQLAAGYVEHALEYMGIGAKTAIGMGRFAKPEKILEQKELEAQWQPSIGDKVLWTDAGEEVIISAIEGNLVTFYFSDDEDSIDTLPIDEFQKI